jgi:Transposase DDE domain group 1
VSELTEWSEGLSLSAGGRKLVGKAGIVPVRRLADKVGLTDALSGALVRRDFHPVHDRGQVLVSAACAVLLGTRSIAGITVMRQAALVLGRPASASTLYRTLDGIGPVQLAKITSARAKVRSRVHDLLDLRPGGFPWIHVDGSALTGWSVLDIDASFVPAHSDKEGAEPHRKGFGLHPLLVFLDNTDEHLVCQLRPGSAGANTASDHIEVSTEAVRQLPTRRRRKILFRADGAGATKEWLAWITAGGRNRAHTREYSVGWSRDEDFWTGLAKVPEKAWTPALHAKGNPREGTVTLSEA